MSERTHNFVTEYLKQTVKSSHSLEVHDFAKELLAAIEKLHAPRTQGPSTLPRPKWDWECVS